MDFDFGKILLCWIEQWLFKETFVEFGGNPE